MQVYSLHSTPKRRRYAAVTEGPFLLWVCRMQYPRLFGRPHAADKAQHASCFSATDRSRAFIRLQVTVKGECG
ncbi:hypothetical protein Pcinc_009390 [Petrolisthes cinctipes]|uniref:Uncharacterized protein n=1 Tax=Petrolisthes cinctipes TaxID=88211 RepID=A0AAE1G764_PETCI|nr:hypothetical protein Pcinc_009390 [Petrolisthes cinctipes]